MNADLQDVRCLVLKQQRRVAMVMMPEPVRDAPGLQGDVALQVQQRRQQSRDGGIAEHDGLQVAAGHLDQIRLAIKGVAGKCCEALAFGRAAAKPASDQIGKCGGKIVMGENETDKSLAEDGVRCRCALRLVANFLPEALARHDRSFRHRCRLRCFDASFSLSDIGRRQPARHAPREATSLHARRRRSYI
ncbi:hypothetical protein ABIB66_006477 [Bradyrhizobium sp. F1.13.3]